MNTQEYDDNIITGETILTQIRLRDKHAIGLRNIRLIDDGIEFVAGFEEYGITGSILLNGWDLYDVIVKSGEVRRRVEDVYADQLSETLVQEVFSTERDIRTTRFKEAADAEKPVEAVGTVDAVEAVQAYKRDWKIIRDWINSDPLEHAKLLLAAFDYRFHAVLNYNDAGIISSSHPLPPDGPTMQTVKDILFYIS
jgi:hypothetical protein